MSESNNEQIKTEGQTVEPMLNSEKPAENVQEPTLPDGVKDRTAAEFEKLKAHNRMLAEENATLKASKPSVNSVLDELRPNLDTVPPSTVPNATPQQLVDEGGYVDATLLNSSLNKAQQDAQEAKRIASQTQRSIQDFQESQIVQAVHKDFPELDPNSDQFDPTFYDFVKNDLVGQMMKGKEDLRAAALQARKILGAKQTAPVQQRKETISNREEASVPTGTGKGAPIPDDERKSLVAGTYKGDKEAIFKRLQASGY